MKKTRECLQEIINDLKSNSLCIKDIANKYELSRNTIHNINNGLVYKQEDIEYPIRKEICKSMLSRDERSLIQLYKDKLSRKQLHIIIGKYTYPTICEAAKEEYDNPLNLPEWSYDLRKRFNIFNLITTPTKDFIKPTPIVNRQNMANMVYVKFLARFGVPIAKVMYVFRDDINSEMSFLSHHSIESPRDMELLLEWHASSSYIMAYIKNVYMNKYNAIGGVHYYYDDFDIENFRTIYHLNDEDLEIIKEMIEFKTQDNYRRRNEDEKN